MKFFDSLIKDTLEIIKGLPSETFPYREDRQWTDAGFNQVILKRDTAFELDGTGLTLVTSENIGDSITVVGDSLKDIKRDRSFARVCLVGVEETEDEQQAYNLTRKIEYVKYHHFPDGYMIRTNSTSRRETVRVSARAIKEGISFENVGSLLISSYKKLPGVRGVQVYFITEPSADYKALASAAEKGNDITRALNHIMNSVNFDCDSCKLKSVCDEVEGMRELHFSKGGM